MRKIIAAILAEHVSALTTRVESATKFLTKLDAKLRQDANARKIDDAADRSKLAELITAARKDDVKQYGRTDHVRVINSILPELNAAQVTLLKSGQFGAAIKAAAERASDSGISQ
jgi:hypothetical protein